MGSFARAHPLTAYLAAIFTVIIIGEHLTSQRCPRCLGYLKKEWSIRHYTCKNGCKQIDPGIAEGPPGLGLGAGGPEFVLAEGGPGIGLGGGGEEVPVSGVSGGAEGSQAGPRVETKQIFQKDVSACFNLMTIFVCLLVTGERPEAFSQKNKG